MLAVKAAFFETNNLQANLQSKMSSSFDQIDWKKLGVFTNDQMFNELLVIYILSTLGFTVIFYVNKMFFGSLMKLFFGPDNLFFSLPEKSKLEYYSRNVSDLHGLIAGPMSIYACFFSCDDPT